MPPENAAPQPRKTLKDIPAECDSLFKDLSEANFDAIGTRFIGLLRVVSRDVIEALDGIGKHLKAHNERLVKLETFAEMAMKMYEEAQAAVEVANKCAAAESHGALKPGEKCGTCGIEVFAVPPKGKPKKNGHAGKPAPLAAVPPAPSTDKEEVKS